MELTVNGITKSFGDVQALKGISFAARSGAPMGLLGRNGAGKTTAMRIIMDIFAPDSGTVLIDGKPIDRHSVRLGYLPEERGLYRKTCVGEQLVYFGRLRGLSRSEAQDAAEQWLKRLDMYEYRDKRVETLSKGNQQRIQLALSLINDPEVIILDEPFSGLDPVNAGQLREIVQERAQMGRLIIFSSHQMESVENICDDIVILKKGSIAVGGSLSEIRAGCPRDRVRIVAEQADRVQEAAQRYGSCEPLKDGLLVRLCQADSRQKLLAELVSAEVGLLTFETVEPSLEEIFVTAAGEETEPQKPAEEQPAAGRRGRRRR